MRVLVASVAVLLAVSAAHAQDRANIPEGNPLGAAAPSAATEQTQQQALEARRAAAARVRANQQAMADAFAPLAPSGAGDPGRPQGTGGSFGQPDVAATGMRSSYGGYYQIRTPWDRR